MVTDPLSKGNVGSYDTQYNVTAPTVWKVFIRVDNYHGQIIVRAQCCNGPTDITRNSATASLVQFSHVQVLSDAGGGLPPPCFTLVFISNDQEAVRGSPL